MEKRYQFRGSLADQSLAEILFKVHQYNVPGVVEASREDVVKRLYLQANQVVFASSSDMRESLGYYLLQAGQLSREDFRRTMRERRDSETRYGHLLIENQLIAPADLRRAIQLQTAQVLWELFSWSEGEVTFSIGKFDPPSHSRIHFPVSLAIKEGVKRSADAKLCIARLGDRSALFEPTFSTEDLITASLEEPEYELLLRVDGFTSLVDLCRGGTYDAATNGKLLYAFQVLQLIRRVTVDRAESSGIFKMRYSASE